MFDHTRGAGEKQLDDGIDHAFVSAGESEDLSVLSVFFFVLMLSIPTAELIPKYNGHALRRRSCLSGT